MTVFLDTFALFAWLSARDPHHDRVRAYLARYKGKFLTTEWVLVEFADGFSDPGNRLLAVAAIGRIRTQPAYEVVPYDPRVFESGFALYAARPDKGWSLTDCISFAVMTERRLVDALTADRHFAQAGFRAVFAD